MSRIKKLEKYIKKIQEELNERRGVERTDVPKWDEKSVYERSSRIQEHDREHTEDAENSETVEKTNNQSTNSDSS